MADPPESDDALEEPTLAESDHPGHEAAPIRRVGPYRMLQRVGQGGMGEVWEAEQVAPLKRRVAIKIIKRGMDTRQVVARFEAERQALARMSHPHVARVFDAGETPDGLPYFAMEFIEGEPIVDYCDRHRLSNRERLELFVRACDGVQHAHQNAVIHRDLKSSNILVAPGDDGLPQPKIIDFGIAKAMTDEQSEETLFTELGQVVGTPEYMSPEQATASTPVDTRTDVYSLGVVLYRLLSGALPFERETLRSSGLAEIQRTLKHDVPRKPSTHVGTGGARSTEAAQARSTDVRAWVRELSGDLDWITLKALEKDPDRRYASPRDLARDIERHLRFEPVEARPPSRIYRLRRFARRHRIGVAFGSLVALFLVALLGLVALYTVRLQSERDRAQFEAARANEVANFLTGIFDQADPFQTAADEDPSARDLLARGAERVHTELAEAPDLRATMLQLIGRVSRRMGDYGQGRELLEQSVEEHRGLESSEGLAAALFDLAVLEYLEGNYDQSLALHEESLALRRTAAVPDAAALGSSLRDLVLVLQELGRFEEALAAGEEAMELARSQDPVAHEELAIASNNLALLAKDQGNFERARELYEQALEHYGRAPGIKPIQMVPVRTNLSSVYGRLGRTREAHDVLLEALQVYEAELGPEHERVGALLINLGSNAIAMDEHEPALGYLERALVIHEATLGPENYRVGLIRANMADATLGLRRADEAAKHARVASTTLAAALGEAHPNTALMWSLEGEIAHARGDLEAARQLQQRSIGALETAVGADHPFLGDPLCQLARVERDAARRNEALQAATRCLEVRQARLGAEHPSTREAQRLTGELRDAAPPGD